MRHATPFIRKGSMSEEPFRTFRSEPEGHYESLFDPQALHVTTWFYRYRNRQFEQPQVIAEIDYPSADDFWRAIDNSRWQLPIGDWRYHTRCEPEVTATIERLHLSDFLYLRIRQRNHRKYRVQGQVEMTLCDNYVARHIHELTLEIRDYSTHELMLSRKFGCLKLDEALAYHRSVLENFDLALMEAKL